MTDHGAKRSVFKTCHDPCMNFGKLSICSGPEDQSENCSFAGHRVARVDLDSASISDHNDASALSQHSEIFCQIHIGQHFSDEIHAASFGDAHDLLFVVHHAVVDDVMRALRYNERTAFFASRGADDCHSQGAGELHARNPDAAARAMNEQNLTCLC